MSVLWGVSHDPDSFRPALAFATLEEARTWARRCCLVVWSSDGGRLWRPVGEDKP